MFSYVRDITPIQPIHDGISWTGKTYSMFRAVHKEGDKYITYVRVCLDGKIGIMSETFNLEWESIGDKKYFGFNICAEDPRLVSVGDKLYVIFIANSPVGGQRSCIWMHEHGTNDIKPLLINGMGFIEKNWAPFDYNGKLMFVYNYDPVIILDCDTNSGYCKECKGSLPFNTSATFIRGGSNLLKIGNEYIGFAHSRLPIDERNKPGFLHLTHKVVLSENLDLVQISKPIFYHKEQTIVKNTIQDPVSFWVEGDRMFVTSNMRDNFSEVYEYIPDDDEEPEVPDNWNECVKKMLETVDDDWHHKK